MRRGWSGRLLLQMPADATRRQLVVVIACIPVRNPSHASTYGQPVQGSRSSLSRSPQAGADPVLTS